MNDIPPINTSSAAINRITTPRAGRDPVATSPVRGTDRVEFSSTAHYLAKLAELPDVRQDLVDRVKGEIEAGTYETDEKVDAAIDALADEL